MPPRRRRPACPAPRPAPTRSPSDVDNLSTEIDASVDPITVNGSTPACANVTGVDTGTAIASTVTVLTGRAVTVTADLNDGADTLEGGTGEDTLRPGRGGGTNDGGDDTDTLTLRGRGRERRRRSAPGGGATTDALGVTLAQSIVAVETRPARRWR